MRIKFYIRLLSVFAMALMCLPATLKAQQKSERRLKIEEQRAELMQTRHQIRVGIGAFPYPLYSHYNTITKYDTPTFSLEYTYRVEEFLEIGGSFAAKFYNRNCAESRYGDFSNDAPFMSEYGEKGTLIAASVFARYSWFNRRWVSFYSSLGIMLAYEFYEQRELGSNNIVSSYKGLYPRNFTSVLPDFVPFGVRVGRKFFAYFEPIGYSNRGVLCMFGFGYKF